MQLKLPAAVNQQLDCVHIEQHCEELSLPLNSKKTHLNVTFTIEITIINTGNNNQIHLLEFNQAHNLIVIFTLAVPMQLPLCQFLPPQ